MPNIIDFCGWGREQNLDHVISDFAVHYLEEPSQSAGVNESQ